MPAIKFDEHQRARAWSFLLEHASEGYFRKDGIVLVKPEVLKVLEKEGIPYQLVNGEGPVGKKSNKARAKQALSSKNTN